MRSAYDFITAFDVRSYLRLQRVCSAYNGRYSAIHKEGFKGIVGPDPKRVIIVHTTEWWPQNAFCRPLTTNRVGQRPLYTYSVIR